MSLKVLTIAVLFSFQPAFSASKLNLEKIAEDGPYYVKNPKSELRPEGAVLDYYYQVREGNEFVEIKFVSLRAYCLNSEDNQCKEYVLVDEVPGTGDSADAGELVAIVRFKVNDKETENFSIRLRAEFERQVLYAKRDSKISENELTRLRYLLAQINYDMDAMTNSEKIGEVRRRFQSPRFLMGALGAFDESNDLWVD